MAYSQTCMLLLLCVSYSIQCPLHGDLCMWNTFGFDHQDDPNGGKVLTSTTNQSYIKSMKYTDNSSPTCEMYVNYTLPQESQLIISMLTQDNSTPLATLLHNDSYRVIQIPLSNHSFSLTLMAMISDADADMVTIQSVSFFGCTSTDLLKAPTTCTVSGGVNCDGWSEEHGESAFKWAPKSGEDGYYYELYPKELSTSAYAELISPSYPYKPGTTCQMTYECLSSGKSDVQMPTVYVYYAPLVGDWLSDDPVYCLIPKKNTWYTKVIKIKTVNERAASFYVRFRLGDADHRGYLRITNITFDKHCFPQLPYSIPPSPSNSSEALNAYITHAVNLSVADRATSYGFLSCASSGRKGPTSEQCKAIYSSPHRVPFVDVEIDDENMPGVQNWVVPKTNIYDVLLYGAPGGFGVETKTSPTSYRGFAEYWSNNAKTLPIWPSFLHVKLKLYEGDTLLIVVGQTGSTACKDDIGGGCKLKDGKPLSSKGGGGGGGGASIVYLERNSTVMLVAIAGGGGGMGRKDMLPNDDYQEEMRFRCSGNSCTTVKVRPGLGGSLKLNLTSGYLRQDGLALAWPFSVGGSLEGGQGCEKYLKYFDTSGGFGGGGGGCTAGGGGGGYVGGAASMEDDELLPGMPGHTYCNEELAELVELKLHDPFTPKHPDGYVEITEVPPPCECGNRACRWLYPNYTDYRCLCNDDWVSKYMLNTDACTTYSQLYQHVDIGAIIASVVSIVVVIILVVVICVILKKTNACKWKQYSSSGHTRIKMDENPNYMMYEGLPDMLSKERITIIRLLGEGKFSTVFEARLALTESWNSPEITVAIKKPKDNSVLTRSEFLQEAKVISAFDHPNIIRIIGICELSDGVIGIAMDVLLGGDLRTFLKEHRPDGQTSASTLLFGDLIKISCQIASACKYLEEKKYIHRDIAARNVLLTEKGADRVAKISDFGLSRDINSGDYCRRNRLRPVPVPIRWYPPEAIKNNVQTTKSDVWSYGVLLWEIFTFGEQPYPGMDNQQVAERIESRYTMDAPIACPPLIGDLMKRCWMYDPKDRPDFTFVHLQLCRLVENEAIMTCPIIDSKQHPRLSSVTSSVSSGFDEMPDSPSCLSIKPLLDNSYNGS